MIKNIAILTGGSSKEKKISLKSARMIYSHIDKKKYNAYIVVLKDKYLFQVIIEKKRINLNSDNFTFSINHQKIQFHKVFMMIHGDPGENGQLCSYFDNLKIPYTSCDKETSILTFNKFKCNQMLKKLGFKVPYSQLIGSKNKLKFPCIIKPHCSGSSLGISKVYSIDDIAQAINYAQTQDNEVMVEEFIEGREFTCGVYSNRDTIETLPITEIISENDIFDYDAKYNGKSMEETPAKIDKILAEKIHTISKQVYIKLKLKSFVRIDFIVNKRTQPYIIEINTIPGFSKESIFPQMLKKANINFTEFISLQIDQI